MNGAKNGVSAGNGELALSELRVLIEMIHSAERALNASSMAEIRCGDAVFGAIIL
jgi:hypothetical protein